MVEMTERRSYRATAERDGPFWLIRVPAIGRSTQARRLDQADDMARDLIAVMTDEDPSSFDVEVHAELDPHLGRLVQIAVERTASARHEQVMASLASRAAARALTQSGLTVRDAGRLLGVSYQRVQQLLASGPPPLTPEHPEKELAVDQADRDMPAAHRADVEQQAQAEHSGSVPPRRVHPARPLAR
jgi:hypothetical protein